MRYDPYPYWMSCWADSRPYAPNSAQGRLVAIIKRVAFGLILTAGLATAVYFANTSYCKDPLVAPLDLTLQQTLHHYGIAGAVFVGIAGMVATGFWTLSAYKSYGPVSQL